jgi:C-terminal processing protease CtpA/Prc
MFGFAYLGTPRPNPIVELEPGIFYVDLERVTDDLLEPLWQKLAAARGVIFDVRGFPEVRAQTIGHLTTAPVSSARFQKLHILRPDHDDVAFSHSRWTVYPAEPRLRGKVVFLTDGSAHHYAEVLLGIVDHHGLATIVGEPTAGTAGDRNPFVVPGGYRILWTALKTLKHDGSRHHGVGIIPSVRVAPTIAGVRAGRDEVLERGLEVIRGQAAASH